MKDIEVGDIWVFDFDDTIGLFYKVINVEKEKISLKELNEPMYKKIYRSDFKNGFFVRNVFNDRKIKNRLDLIE